MKDTAKHQNLSQFAQLNSVNSSRFYLSIIVPYMMFLHFQTEGPMIHVLFTELKHWLKQS